MACASLFVSHLAAVVACSDSHARSNPNLVRQQAHCRVLRSSMPGEAEEVQEEEEEAEGAVQTWLLCTIPSPKPFTEDPEVAAARHALRTFFCKPEIV